MQHPRLPQRRHDLLALSRLLLLLGALGGGASLFLTLGFSVGSRAHGTGHLIEFLVAAFFVLEHALRVATAGSWREALQRRWLGNVLIALLVVTTLGVVGARVAGWSLTRPAAFLGGAQHALLHVFVILSIGRAVSRLGLGLAWLHLRPAAISFSLFTLLVLGGTALLLLPRMAPAGQPVPFIDALFTSTSAACVTGLTTIDIGTRFTLAGQTVIMLLIQAGGIGIMVLAAFFAMIAGRGIGIRERSLMRETMSLPILRRLSSIVRFIIVATLACELAGAALLIIGFRRPGAGMGELFFEGLFHSISAFCNAGLSPFATNLIGFARNPLVVLTVLVLLVLGGLGFTVLMELWRQRGRLRIGHRRMGRPERLSEHARLTLAMTGALLLGGWLLVLVFEWNHSLAGLPLGHRLLCGLFTAGTPRTAGFTVTETTLWTHATSFLIILLMIVGGSAGGTAGGIKTTTLGVMLAAVRALVLNRERAVVFKREVPWRHIHEAAGVITVYIGILCLGTLGLILSDGQGLRECLFEAASALGTVGLSLGITPALTPAGKLICVLLMLAGRVGPLTLAMALAAPSPRAAVRYPEGRFMIG
jgi:trk system potassium uptake protein TrkH